MVATIIELTIEDAGAIADDYISQAFDPSFFTTNGKKVDDGWHFTVKCHRDDMTRTPAVGGLTVFESGDVETLSDDRIRDMKEAAETQAAQQRQEFARGEDGYVLRYHARIKASCWLAKKVDLKISASSGVFIPIENPIWRFSVYDSALLSDDDPLGIIDVDATTGEVQKLDEEEIEIIIRGACASRRYPEYTTTA